MTGTLSKQNTDFLLEKMGEKNLNKLQGVENEFAIGFVEKFIKLCNPDTVFVCDDSPEDVSYIREKAMTGGEEKPVGLSGQTIHYDGFYDQARDKNNSKYLLEPGVNFGTHINSIDKQQGLSEINDILKNSMAGKELFIRFFCLGPQNSPFSLCALQLTDSAYVLHSEDLLYRGGYKQFKKLQNKNEFFRFVHSAGVLDEKKVCKNTDKRRVYIDLSDNTVYSTNTQYGGNTIGLKKLAMRLAIKKASMEDWLTEHMFIMGVHGPKNRVTYFTGAFPSACGKTSTSMLPGETIIGDDIAYFRIIEEEFRAVNVEKGIFGIIQDVNSKDDPLIWKILSNPGETIFSNILIDENKNPFWLGKGGELPTKGINHSGEWHPGKKDKDGNEITVSHKNARYTIPLARLENLDPKAEDPFGVTVGAIVYGGRDSDTTVPVEQAFNWEHGITTKGASLESETTAATLGQEGVRKFNLMSNLDFLSYSLGEYINNNLKFGKRVKETPLIFSVNYFLKNKNGKYLNAMEDKAVWIKWAELRCHNDVEALETPTGFIPKYEDLKCLFNDVLKKDYTKEQYEEQFTVRIPELIAKIDRIEKVYKKDILDAPEVMLTELVKQRARLEKMRAEMGDNISPFKLL